MADRKSTESPRRGAAGNRAPAPRFAVGLALSLAAHAVLAFAAFGLLPPSSGSGPDTDASRVALDIFGRPAAVDSPGPSAAVPPSEPPPSDSRPAEGRRRRQPQATPTAFGTHVDVAKNAAPGQQPHSAMHETGPSGGSGSTVRTAAGPANRQPSTVNREPSTINREPSQSERRAYALTLRRAIRRSGRYPPVARRRRIEGQAVLGIRVEDDGRVADVRLVESSRHRILDSTALSWAHALRDLPPPPGGAMDVIVPVEFSLRR